MIKLITIIKQEGESCTIGFSARDQEGCSVLEGNIADLFKTTLSKTRELIFQAIPEAGVKAPEKVTLVDEYLRTFDNPEDRDTSAETLDKIKARMEAAGKLPPEVKKRANNIIGSDPEMVANIVHSSFLAGMQLAMRICRNRAKDAKDQKIMTMAGSEAQNCAGLIRICQVEIGSGRMPRPQFTQEEYDEMDRIS